MLTNISDALQPVIFDLCAALLTLLIEWVSLTLKTRLGFDFEARHREALHSAIMSGRRSALEQDLDRSDMIDAAVAYARTSVPDAITSLAALAEWRGLCMA
ncbi:hypothetical protein [Roseisalinus antarcticus]|uniref:Uncharacterized protein n=1 Tax=Roseisalinus antarcticus TaxID=254357 RepID=A0A1Y5TW98_9RHOB|nr:hypothetical protein [Roseisalinus antarcticus]SLN75075.1 hypothetical protein ROA7023_03888 [Roseisalinus antarcticus]